MSPDVPQFSRREHIRSMRISNVKDERLAWSSIILVKMHPWLLTVHLLVRSCSAMQSP